MRDFAGISAWITGGSSGIGLATGELLARQGAHVLLLARGASRLEEAVRMVRAARRAAEQQIEYRMLDVTDEDAVQRVCKQAVTTLGAPSVLINCAGGVSPRPFEEVTSSQLDAIMQQNLFGARHMIAALLPHMRRGSVIVNVASIAGLIGLYGYTDYCASKFALIGFSEALRSELAPRGIRVLVLCPPDTDTPGYREETLRRPAATSALAGTVRPARPERVAEALLHGLARGQSLIIPGLDGRLTWLAKRLMPGLLEAIMDRTVRRALLEPR